jgi:hypothetical protein
MSMKRTANLGSFGARARLVLATLAFLAGCSDSAHPQPSVDTAGPRLPVNVMPMTVALSGESALADFASGDGAAPAADGGLQCPFHAPQLRISRNLGDPQVPYYGGRVISNTQIVQVNWGATGVYETHITDGETGRFYAGIVNSRYVDALSEYSTRFIRPVDQGRGSAQYIGRGTFGGAHSITPGNSATALTDVQVTNEIDAQIASGALPAPTTDAQGNVNTVYFVHLPKGISVQTQGVTTCKNFCAFHSTWIRGGQSAYYAVMPDFGPGSGCDTKCFPQLSPFQRTAVIASHELGEAITDAEVGLLPNPPPVDDAGVLHYRPEAWQNNNGVQSFNMIGGEIGDICLRFGGPTTVDDANGNVWPVQKLWSNAADECMSSHLSNGGFEQNGLTAWTPTGSAVVGIGAHTGQHALLLGSATVAADSSVVQTFDLPDPYGGGTVPMSFWYDQACNDPSESTSATVTDQSTGQTRVLLAPTCVAGQGWLQAGPIDLTDIHGHTVTVTIANHGSASASSPHVASLIDDVTVSTSLPSTSNPIVSGSFEPPGFVPDAGGGYFIGWTTTGTVVSSNAKFYPVFTGVESARTGDFAPTAGDSSLSQTFTAQAGATTIQLHFYLVCQDVVGSDWATVTLTDTTASTTSTLLPNTCTNTCSWTRVSGAVVAGHNYTLTMTSHDDNAPGTATYAFWDDVSVQ